MFDPINILLAKIRECFLEIVYLRLCDGEILNEVSDSFKPSEDDILPTEGILSEENLESCLIFVLVVLEVGVGAGELVEIVEEKVDLVLVVAHFSILKKSNKRIYQLLSI